MHSCHNQVDISAGGPKDNVNRATRTLMMLNFTNLPVRSEGLLACADACGEMFLAYHKHYRIKVESKAALADVPAPLGRKGGVWCLNAMPRDHMLAASGKEVAC